MRYDSAKNISRLATEVRCVRRGMTNEDIQSDAGFGGRADGGGRHLRDERA